ncbi:hypothetical protein MDAP_002412 [Mitosporidium daphniae]
MSKIDYSLPDMQTFTSEYLPEIARNVEPSPTASPSTSPKSQKRTENKLPEMVSSPFYKPSATPDLVSHVSFFDRNNDGVILPWETYETLHSDLGINSIISMGATAVLHLCMSYATSDSWIPDPFFGITVANISRCRLGSHCGVYDSDGRIDVNVFEKQFGRLELKDYFKSPQAKLAAPHSLTPRLTLADAWEISAQNDSLLDVAGWVVDKVMWILLAVLENNSISKSSLLDCYKGNPYFEAKRKQRSTENPG